MTTVYEILLLVNEDKIVEVEKTKRSNGFDRIVKSPSRQNVSKASATKNYQISPRLPLFNSLSSQEKAMYCRYGNGNHC